MPIILIVDDDADTVRMLSTGISIFGFTCVPAFSGLEAVKLFESRRFDAVVLDLMLPDIDGYEVARRLRAIPGANGVPIVVVSATADADAGDRSLQAGASHFFRKPVNLRSLAALLKELTE
jgi:DNA-binding response OmpR family regulator